jgi:hypothetical protein
MGAICWNVAKFKLRKHLMACILMLLIIFVSLIGVEILGRWYLAGNPFYFFDQRFIYTTPDAFRNLGNFWTYKPSSVIDEVGIYRTSLGNFFAEYECRYESDRMGFFNRDSEHKNHDLLLLGDSFTSGSGGCSWTTMLEAKLPGYSIYNAALPGTGVANWSEIEQYLLAQGFTFRHVVMVFIVDDFWRPLRQKRELELDCLHEVARCTWQVFYPLDPTIDLVKTSERRAPHQLTKKIEYFWRRNFWVTHALYDNPLRSFTVLLNPNSTVISVPDYSTNAMDRLIRMSDSLDLVHVPTKGEIVYQPEPPAMVAISRLLKSRNLRSSTCALTLDDFFDYDAHPTRQGYEKLSECVARVVGGLDQKL